jgi:hypothetical protein
MSRHILSPLFQTLLLSLFSANLLAGAQRPDGLTLAGSTAMPFTLGSGTFAVWSGGAFIGVQDRFSRSPIIRTFDRNGTQVSQFSFNIPGVSLINIYDNCVARGMDGSLAIVGTAFTDDSRGGMFVAWVSPNREEQMIVRTSPFFPRAVTVASDGTIWVAGDETKPRPEKPDYSQNLIRRYDKTGKLLGSFIAWSSLGTGPSTISPTPSVRSVLLSLKDRIGWYSPGSNTYIEFALEGSVIKRFKTAPHQREDVINAALCDDGGLFATTHLTSANQTSNWGVLTLDRQRGEWSPIPRSEKWGMLFGCDGTRLATATDFKTISWLEPVVK